MNAKPSQTMEILRELGDGLILRRASSRDAEALAEFNAQIHGNLETGEPDQRVGVWTHDLLSKPHPTFNPGDFTIVEEARTGKIVSSLNLISQTWSYAGVPFKVGRPELVGTHPDYRGQGLVRAQFEVIHQWSAERGEKVQAITGIPYYYRLFGYEMALSLSGGRAGYRPQVPKLKDGEQEPYRIRPAQEADLSFIADLYEGARRRYLVSCNWDQALWRYELLGKSPTNVNRAELRMIETPQGEPVGYLAHSPFNWGAMLAAYQYELQEGISWAAVTPPVIRYLYRTGAQIAGENGKADEFDSFGFWLGLEHPVYTILREGLPRVRKPYAWYLRVADLADFLRHISPVLEARLAASALAGHSGEFKLTFYRTGLKFKFENGRISQVLDWRPAPQGHSGNAAFPDLTFLQLLFGYRSLEELGAAFADCWTESDEAFALLNALFPKQNTHVWPVS